MWLEERREVKTWHRWDGKERGRDMMELTMTRRYAWTGEEEEKESMSVSFVVLVWSGAAISLSPEKGRLVASVGGLRYPHLCSGGGLCMLMWCPRDRLRLRANESIDYLICACAQRCEVVEYGGAGSLSTIAPMTSTRPRLRNNHYIGLVESVEDDIRRIHTDVVNSALKWGQVLKDYSLKKRNIMESLDAIEAKYNEDKEMHEARMERIKATSLQENVHDNDLSSIVDHRIVKSGKLAQPLYSDFVVLERRWEYTKHTHDDVNDALKQSHKTIVSGLYHLDVLLLLEGDVSDIELEDDSDEESEINIALYQSTSFTTANVDIQAIDIPHIGVDYVPLALRLETAAIFDNDSQSIPAERRHILRWRAKDLELIFDVDDTGLYYDDAYKPYYAPVRGYLT
uniref:(California timema) hypothetical protein n=1 Tax=Timema californicum TaxID=61474 RepID=A0A7R9JBR7_TIMCA|nr:unnamed protein product [Timema californicum]